MGMQMSIILGSTEACRKLAGARKSLPRAYLDLLVDGSKCLKGSQRKGLAAERGTPLLYYLSSPAIWFLDAKAESRTTYMLLSMYFWLFSEHVRISR